MFEPKVKEHILADALKIALAEHLEINYTEDEVKKGLKGKVGECIKNSIAYNNKRICIGFCVFEGNDLINSINVVLHALNYDKNRNMIDNTDLGEYKFYSIDECIPEVTEKELRKRMIKIGKGYKKLAIQQLKLIYKDIQVGSFSFK